MMKMKENITVNEMVKLINTLRELDEHSVNVVSTVIVSELNASKMERKKVLSIVR